MNLCKFAPMIASLITCVARFLREIAHAILSKSGLFRASGKAFVRFGVLATVAVLGWTGFSGEVTSVVAPTGQASIAIGINIIPNAHAAKTDGTEVVKETGVKTINAIFNLMYALLTPLLMLAGWLLTPDWVFGEIFGLRPVLHDMWILISNIVYVIFAFLLVAMAFMNIFGSEGNTWAIKAKLPKLIVGIISVPFTWFFVSAVVSVASILTASAVQLAGDLAPGQLNEFELSVPPKCTIDFTASASSDDAPAATDAKTATAAESGGKAATKAGKFLDCPESDKKIKFSEMFKSNNAFGIVSYYAYGVFKIQDYKNITKDNLSTIKNALNLGVNILIALVMFVVFFFIIIALVFALLSRALYFWAIAIFSPLLSLRYFFEGKLGGFGDKWLSVTHIIGLALVPVYVAAALSFGLIFTSMVTTTKFDGIASDYVKIDAGATKEKTVMTVFGTEYTVKGTPVGTQTYKDGKTIGGGFIGQIVMQFAALGVLWFAVMAALKGSEITKEAAAPIEKFGGEIGSLIQSLPKYAPIIPTGHGAASLNSLPTISGSITNAMRGNAANRGNEIGGRINDTLGINSEATRKLNNTLTRIEGLAESRSGDTSLQMAKDAMKQTGYVTKDMGSDGAHKVWAAVIGKSNMSQEKKTEMIKEANNLTGDKAQYTKFLEEYNKAIKSTSTDFNEAHEMDAYVTGSKPAESGTTPSQASDTINIKITDNDTASVKMEFVDANKKKLKDDTVKKVKEKMQAATAGKGDAEKAAKLKEVKEELTKWLKDNGLDGATKEADLKEILKSVGLDNVN